VDRSAHFRAFLPDAEAAFAETLDLEAQLERWLDRAHAAWPDLVDDGALLAYTAARVCHGALPRAPAGDVALACAVMARLPGAVETFDREVIVPLGRAIGRKHPPDRVHEVQQRVRVQLLADEGGLASYAGTGPLRAWVRVLAVREAERLRAAADRSQPIEEAAALADGALVDPERLLLRASTRRVMHEGLRAAMDVLEPRMRTVLRYHYVDRLGIDRIAPLLSVHRATAARWVEEARAALIRQARHVFEREFGAAPEELRSVLGALESQLEISLGVIFSDQR
jgi:RNA polymerase sigma-70 factor (ECF subfamily)